MNLNTISIIEYLNQKGVEFREQGNELIAHCIFHNCDEDSRGSEAHLYFSKQTGQYHCKKCCEEGNIFTLAKFFGDKTSAVMTDGWKSNLIKNDIVYMSPETIWHSATEAPSNFSYLTIKKVQPHGARFKDNKLVLPLYDSNGVLTSLQYIHTDGKKEFLSGGKTASSFYIIGDPVDTLCIAEGFATAASINEATGHAVAVAYSAGNLMATTKEVKKMHPTLKIIICADNDDTGILKATKAAMDNDAYLVYPKFESSELINNKKPNDFNDLFVLKGVQAVKDSMLMAKMIPQKNQFTSLEDLLDEPDETIEWIVDDLLPSGGFSILVAKPKVGKSTIARQLAISVANGDTFLGRRTSKGRVLYVSLEEKRNEVRNHFRLLGAAGTEDIGIYVDSTPENALSWLEHEIERSKPFLVIIDTLFRFARVRDVNDYAKTLDALDPLLSLARRYSVHLMGLHHAKKSGGDGADVTLGSTAIFGSVDTAIILKSQNGKRTIETQQRYGYDIEQTILLFDQESKSFELGGTKQKDDLQTIEATMLAFLEGEREPVKEELIDQNSEGRTNLKRKALRELVENGKVKRTGSGKKGDPYYYSCSLVPATCMEQENNN